MSRAVKGLYEFGPFRVDLERRVFARGQQVLPLAPKTFDLLVLLVQHPGRALSKQELMSCLWPGTFVEEANLSFQISVLRKTLGEDGARFIETVPKHGYRFDADVRATIPSGTSSPEPLNENEPSSVVLEHSNRKVWLAGATVTAALLAVVAFLAVGREPRAPAVRRSPALAVPLTAYPGFERTPSLSVDGSRVAFSWNGPALDNYDIYVKLAGPGEPERLTTNGARDDSPAWSPDGRFIAFLRYASSNTAADLVVIPAHGGFARARGGDDGGARSILAELEERSRASYVSPYDFAIAHAGLGDTDAALTYLEHAYRERVMRIISLGDPEFDDFRREPRFVALARQLRLPAATPVLAGEVATGSRMPYLRNGHQDSSPTPASGDSM